VVALDQPLKLSNLNLFEKDLVVTGQYATSRKLAESSPDEVGFFNLPNPSSRTRALG
jgi:hypothetical protein